MAIGAIKNIGISSAVKSKWRIFWHGLLFLFIIFLFLQNYEGRLHFLSEKISGSKIGSIEKKSDAHIALANAQKRMQGIYQRAAAQHRAITGEDYSKYTSKYGFSGKNKKGYDINSAGLEYNAKTGSFQPKASGFAKFMGSTFGKIIMAVAAAAIAVFTAGAALAAMGALGGTAAAAAGATTMVAAGTAAVTSAGAAIAGASLGAGMIAAGLGGLAAGLVTGTIGMAANGFRGKWFKSVAIPALISAAVAAGTFGIGHGLGLEKLGGNIAGINKSVGEMTAKPLLHGALQGGARELQGGDFEDGFRSGAIASLAGDTIDGLGGFLIPDKLENNYTNIALTTISGGVVEEATGGDFWDGAATAAAVGIFNHAMANNMGKEIRWRTSDGKLINLELDDDTRKYQVAINPKTGEPMVLVNEITESDNRFLRFFGWGEKTEQKYISLFDPELVKGAPQLYSAYKTSADYFGKKGRIANATGLNPNLSDQEKFALSQLAGLGEVYDRSKFILPVMEGTANITAGALLGGPVYSGRELIWDVGSETLGIFNPKDVKDLGSGLFGSIKNWFKGGLGSEAGSVINPFAGGWKKTDDFVTLYRGDSLNVTELKSYATWKYGENYSDNLIKNSDLDELMKAHAISSKDPLSPFISVTSDPRVADYFSSGSVFEIKIPKNRVIFNPHNKMEIPLIDEGIFIPESEWLIPNLVKPNEIINIKRK